MFYIYFFKIPNNVIFVDVWQTQNIAQAMYKIMDIVHP